VPEKRKIGSQASRGGESMLRGGTERETRRGGTGFRDRPTRNGALSSLKKKKKKRIAKYKVTQKGNHWKEGKNGRAT